MKCTQPHSPLALPQSHCSIHLYQSSTFTLQYSRHSIHAALKQQHSRCTYAAAFTPQQPLCCSTHTSDTTALPVFRSSHAAALMQQLSRCHIYAAAFTQQCSIHAEAGTQQHSCFTYATTLTLVDEGHFGLTMPLHNLAMQASGSWGWQARDGRVGCFYKGGGEGFLRGYDPVFNGFGTVHQAFSLFLG